jgi:hypothetical protein
MEPDILLIALSLHYVNEGVIKDYFFARYSIFYLFDFSEHKQ